MKLRYPVQSSQCKSCIFREGSDVVSQERLVEIQQYLLAGKTHLCHSPDQSKPKAKRKNTHACKGARDWQLSMWYRLGYISAPTVDALQEELLKKP
jgi:hypothetical protein